MPKITGTATFNIEGSSNNKVSKDDGKLNLSFVTDAESLIENTGSDVNNNTKTQLVSSVIETKNTIYVQGLSHLVNGKRMAAQTSGNVPSVAISQASEVLDVDKVESLVEAFQNNLRKFELSNPRQWLSINNHAPRMESVVEKTNDENKVFESTTEKYVVRLDYKIDNLTTDPETSSFTYTTDEIVGSANVDNIETNMFLVVDKYVKDENSKWVYSTSSLATEISTEFPLKGDFTTTINEKEMYVGTIETSVENPEKKNTDINGLNISYMNLNKRFLSGLQSGNTIGKTYSLKDNDKRYKQRGGYILGPDVDMSRRVLKDLDLSDINLHNADFSNTKFINIKSGKIQGTPILPKGYKIMNRYIVGPFVNLENAVLRDEDFTGMNLSGVNLTGANLNRITSGNVTHDKNTKLPTNYKIVNGYIIGPGVNLTNAKLMNTDLSDNIYLSHVNAKGVDFTGAKLTGATLENADLSSAILTGIQTGNIKGGTIEKKSIVKLPEKYMFYNGFIIGSGTNLDKIFLSFFDFRLLKENNVKLTNISGTPFLPNGYKKIGGFIVGKYIDFSNEDLSSLDFSDMDVSNSIFTGANISLLNLTDTIMNNVVSGNIEQAPFFAKENTYKLFNGFLIGPGVNFSGAQLAEANLISASLNGALALNISGIPKLSDSYKLVNQNIVGPNINLTGANFEYEDLSKTDLRGVKSGQIVSNETTILPTGYKLIGGYIIGKNVILTDADLSNLDLSETTLEGVVSGNVKTNSETKFPYGYEEINGYIVGKGVVLQGANLRDFYLSYLNLENVDLRNANLTNVNFQNSILTGALLEGIISDGVTITVNTKLPTGYKEKKGYIIGKGVVLRNANLRNMDLRNMDLRNVNFQNVNFQNANLSDTQLEGVISGNVKTNSKTTFPDGYKKINGYIVGKGVNLTDADLNGEDLTNLNISGANLTNADLSNTTLKMVISGNIKININTKFPTGYREANGHIVGKGVDLKNGRLINVDLSDIDLSDSLLEKVAGRNVYINDKTKFPKGYTVKDGYIFGKDVSFEYVTLSDIDLSDIDLSGVNMRRCSSNNVTINENTKLPARYVVRKGIILGKDVNLKDAYLSGIDLRNIDLRNAILDGVRSEYVSSDSNTVLPNGYMVLDGHIVGPNVNLRNMTINLSGQSEKTVNYSGINFEGAHLSCKEGFDNRIFTGANLKKANLTELDFDLCNFSNVDMTEANVDKVGFTSCTFNSTILKRISGEGISIDSSTLSNTDLSYSNLKISTLTNTDFTSTNIQGCDFSSPDELDVADATRISNCNFNGLDMIETRFQNTRLHNNKFIDCYLVDANLKGISEGSGNDFSNAFLSGADLRGSKLVDSDFTNCELSYTDFTNANLYLSTFTSAILVNTIFKNSRLDNANLSGVDLSGVDLSGVRMWSVNLSEADLSGADLSRVKIRNSDLTGANLSGADLSSAESAGADLTGANLSGADLSRADLSRVDLIRVNLSGADLSGAYLIGANLSGADLSGADLQDVITNENTTGPDSKKGWDGKLT